MLGNLHNLAATPADAAASSGQDAIVSGDVNKSRAASAYIPTAPSQQNLNQFIQMNLIQLQRSGISLHHDGQSSIAQHELQLLGKDASANVTSSE